MDIYAIQRHDDPGTTVIDLLRQKFDRWNLALMSGNAGLVAAHYATDATFLPTRHWGLLIGKREASVYFRHFLESRPAGEIIRDSACRLGSGIYLHWGDYNFTLGPADERRVINASFTFVWINLGSDIWEIGHHHSSIKEQRSTYNYRNLLDKCRKQDFLKKKTRIIAPGYIERVGLFRFENHYNRQQTEAFARFSQYIKLDRCCNRRLIHSHISARPE